MKRKCGSLLGILSLVVLSSSCLFAQEPSKSTPVTTDATVSRSDRPAAEAFSSETLVYVETKSPTKVIQLILGHPLREEIESIPQVKAALKSKQYVAFLAGVGVAQVYADMPWDQTLDTIAGKGMAIGFEPGLEALGGVFSSAHPDKIDSLYRGLLKLANQNEQSKVSEGDYRGQKAFSIGKQLFLILLDDRVLVSNKKPMVKKMVDRWLDGSESLAQKESFQSASSRVSGSTAWAWGNLKTIRESGMAKQLFREHAENIGAELLVGGLLEVARTANDLVASFNVQNDRIELGLQADWNEDNIPSQRSYFFGTADERQAFQRIQLPNALVDIAAFRDLGKLWLSKEDLFDENHLAELSQADSTLSTLFSGLDFGEEVLGSTKPGFQIIARNQDFEELKTPKPDIRIPEFATVFRLKTDNEKVKRRLRVAYQNFIGFLNIQLAMQGQPQLDLLSEKQGNVRLVSATYLPEEGKEREGIINYNFSPTVAFTDQWFIISSTKSLAADLATAGGKELKPGSAKLNTAIEIYGKQVKEILSQNAEQLIAQNMLEEGNDREEAESQIDLILNLVGLVKNVSLKLENPPERLELKLGLQLNLDETR